MIMETQAMNNNEKKENLKRAATMTGSAIAGAGVMVAADVIRGEEDIEVVEPIDEETDNATVTTPDSDQTAQEQPAPEPTVSTPTTHEPSHTAEPQPQGEAHESAAENNAETSNVQNETADVQQPIDIDVNDIPDVDPTLVAQNLTEDVVMVDPTDNDLANIDISAVGTVETVDGEVLTAAQFTGDNGETLYMVDVNGNGEYDVVTDEAGNILADVPSTLTVSDSQSIVSANVGDYSYLAHDDTDNATDTDIDNPMDDIVELG